MKIEFDHPTRGKHYRQANEEYPAVRRREIEHMLCLLDPRPGETVVDFGCGNGVLTRPISERVGPRGKVYAVDNSRQSMLNLTNRIGSGNTEGVIVSGSTLPLPGSTADAVVSLANFHHVPDKPGMLREFARVLKPGGKLVIGDVAQGTPVQRYFDGPVDRFCSTGHKHTFLCAQSAQEACLMGGLSVNNWELREVPWEFKSETEAQRFLHLIHDATCSPEVCLQEAKSLLGFMLNGSFLLQWQLFFLTANKPVAKEVALLPESSPVALSAE
ncbi:MAG: methyltransferase domain-containing protein [Planctomycetes bacterium]|nr:methyltransferase domain-containing protein [Planctomycetota bacterium]